MKQLLLLLFSISALPALGQFHMIGDAQPMQGNCIMLTPDEPYREGIAYHKTKLNLKKFFEIEFDIYLGNKDEGADGITFVIHTDPRGYEAFGTWGECMGYGRWRKEWVGGAFIAPSVAVEFDTYQNLAQNDPESDHAAYLENGTNFHEKFWNNGNMAFNLEDDKLHSFRFRWEPDVNQVTVFLDDQIVYAGVKDLANDIFEGAEEAIWGFTASTGRKYNLQYFCLRSWVSNEEVQWDRFYRRNR